MSESVPLLPQTASVDVSGLDDALAALQHAGADRLAPVHWHYLQTLRASTPQQNARVQMLLQAKLQAALAALQVRMQHIAGHHMPTAATQGPRALASTAVETLAGPPTDNPEHSPLVALTQYLAEQAQALDPQEVQGGPPSQAASGLPVRPELKAVRQFRNTWSKLSADQQLNRALDLAPKNAGPINSHMLVLRSLALMRDISPDYLNRFMSYADALLCLDLPLLDPTMAAKVAGIAAKKARAPRAKAAPSKPH
jgi:hypothetical protein